MDDLASMFDNISIICFNYDRCIEHYLYSALVAHYGITKPAAAKIMGKLRIHHPYGVISRSHGRIGLALVLGRTTTRCHWIGCFL